MALGNLPYRHKIVSRRVDANGAPVVTVEVRDGVSALVKTTIEVSCGADCTLREMRDLVDAQVERVMRADAGDWGTMVDGIIARSGVLP